MDPTFDDIAKAVERYWPNADLQMLQRAYDLAYQAHDGQKRKSGEPYIVHPLSVSYILTEIESDPASIAAGLLHDTAEDTTVTIPEITEQFGPVVAGIVEGVTKLSSLNFRTAKEEQARNLRKMFLAMADDVRVILVKLADRLHNMRTLDSLSPERREGIALETRMIFAPLAHRLGVWRIKWELEDLALRHLEPEAYREVAEKIGKTRAERERDIESLRVVLAERLRAAGIRAQVFGRPKHVFSIYNKMRKENLDFDQIGDLMALRVITPTVGDCYAALGIVHDLWMPLQGLFTDYIAKPKANGYQSLHTKVLGPGGGRMEVQIRTQEMHRVAEYGVAAHWRYKEGSSDPELDRQVGWLRQLLDLENDLKESHEFVELLEAYLFKDQVFVFTPQGDVIDLPIDGTPIDFAYRIHTQVGHHCVGAKVNGRLVPLDYHFKTGDVAEIVTQANSEPSLDWLNFAQSQHARTKIRRFLRQKTREESIEWGRQALDRELERLRASERAEVLTGHLDEVARHLNYLDAEGLYAAIGYGDVEPLTVINHLRQPAAPSTLLEEVARYSRPRGATRGDGPQVSARGVSGFSSRPSKCCNPLPGDDIVGYITRGGGLAIHRSDCKNLRYRREREPERVIALTWEAEGSQASQTDIEVIALDRVGLFAHIAAVVADLGVNIRAAEAHMDDARKLARITLTVEIKSRQELDELIEHLTQLIDVVSARPLTGTGA